MGITSTLWIIHRDARQRAALARIAGAGDSTYLGAPSDELFASASAADIVLLAPSGDFECELEFVHRFNARLPNCTWVLLPRAADLAEAQRLFDNLPATFLAFPPRHDRLRQCIAKVENHRNADPLSRRHGRDLLAARLSRWFVNVDLPDLLRALDPQLGPLPLLIRGEEGTGRGLVARYVHAFGGSDVTELLHLPCAGVGSEPELLRLIGEADPRNGDRQRTIWLEDVDRLPASLQLRVRDWIEYGLPGEVIRSTRVRFIASAHDAREQVDETDTQLPHLSRGLESTLSGLVIALPPLRERAACIRGFVVDSTLAWSAAHGERPRTFGEQALRELSSYPWPGNMTELEMVVHQSLSHSSANPLEPHHLRFNGVATATAEAALPAAEFAEGSFPEPEPFPIAEEPAPSHGVDLQAAMEPHAPPHAAPRDAEPDLDDSSQQIPEEARGPLPAPGPGQAETTAQHLDETFMRRLVGALFHEVRNPLVSIRTFSELLPDHHADEEFRDRFAELVGADVRQIEHVLSRLRDLSELGPAQRKAIDLAVLLDRILDNQRALIQERHLLVLKELDRDRPLVLADEHQLERAISGLFATALSMVPERGDVYLASKFNSNGSEQEPGGAPTVRFLVRYHSPSIGRPLSDILVDDGFRVDGITPAETTLELLIAEAIVDAQGGSMTLDTSGGQETVIVVDLPAALD